TILPGLPDPAAALGSLLSALELVEQVTAGDPATQIPALLDRLSAQLSGRNSSALDFLEEITASISSAPELKGLIELFSKVLRAGGAGSDPLQTLRDLPAAFAASIQAIGALMSLKSLLAEGDRLTRIMSLQLDADTIAVQVAALRSSFAEAAATLAA